MQLPLIFALLLAAAVAVALVVLLRQPTRSTARQPQRSTRKACAAPAAPAAACAFQVGKAYWCRDKGWGDTASEVLRRTGKKVLISCDIICKRSDVTAWRSVKVVDGVETLERGRIRADDEYTGKRGYGELYAAAKGV